MSRMQAKKQLDLEEYKDTMKDVWSTSVNSGTIDEAPMAYKPMESIIENIKTTATIIDVIKPIYNFKANEDRRR
jgi:tRNA-splicing ligase RtcB